MSSSPSITETFPVLSPEETQRMAFLEGVIRAGIKTFVEVGNALLEIREQRLYKGTHSSFEAYCRERWDMSRMHASRMIQAADIISSLGGSPPPPTAEAQVRSLARLPRASRAEAWEAAARSAPNGKPTAKHVEAVVDRLAPKPDSPDIKAQRDAGLIPEGVEVTVTEPEPLPEDAGEVDSEDDLSDEEFLASCPVREKLVAVLRSRFDLDALLYRKMKPFRLAMIHNCKPLTKQTKLAGRGHIGTYMARYNYFIKAEHPNRWIACFDCRNADGLSTGMVQTIGGCPKCRGNGYLL